MGQCLTRDPSPPYPKVLVIKESLETHSLSEKVWRHIAYLRLGVRARPEVESQSRLNKPRVMAAGQCPAVGLMAYKGKRFLYKRSQSC